MQLTLVLVLFITVILQGFKAQAESTSVSVDAFHAESANYRGHTLRAGVARPFTQDLKYEFSAENLNRTYSDDSKLTDTQFALSGVALLAPKFYLDSRISGASGADIYAQWSIATTPHFTVGYGDVGFGFKYDQFKNSRTGTVTPSYFHSFTDNFGLGIGAFVVRTETWSTAYQAQALIRFLNAHSFRLVGSTGRTIEDAGLIAEFKSVTGRYVYDLSEAWHISFSYTSYWSDIRGERSAGIGLEYR